MGDLRRLIFGLVLFCLFAFLMVYTAVQMGTTYDIDSNEIGDGALDYDKYNAAINNVTSSAEGYRARFGLSTDEGEKTEGDQTGWKLFGIIKDTWTIIYAPFRLLSEVFYMLNTPSVVISTILGVIALLLIFALFKLWKTGD